MNPYELMTIQDNGGDIVAVYWSGRDLIGRENIGLAGTVPPTPRRLPSPGQIWFVIEPVSRTVASRQTMVNDASGSYPWPGEIDPEAAR